MCTNKSGSACVFDTDAMTVIQQLQPHSSAVTQVLAYKEGRKLISASVDGTICLWNGEKGEILAKFDEQESAVNCLAITGTKDLLMTGAENGEVGFWSIDTGKKLHTFSDHSSGVLAVAFITQNRDQFMFSSSRDGSLCIREFQSAKTVVSSQVETGELVSTALAPNAAFLVCGSRKGPGYIVSLPYGTLTDTLTGHTGSVNTVKVFPDSGRCVSGSSDRTVRVWSISEAVCTAVLHVDAPVLACDVNYSNTILYGMEGGWVSTAAFQSDLSRPNPLISRLNARGSPTLTASSSVTTPGSVADRAGPKQNDDDDDGQESIDQGELPQPHGKDNNISLPRTEPDPEEIATNEGNTDCHTSEGAILEADVATATTETLTRAIDTTLTENVSSATTTNANTSRASALNTTDAKSSTCSIL